MTESNSKGEKPKLGLRRAAAPGMPHLSRDQLRNAAELEPQIRQRALETARSRGQADGYSDRRRGDRGHHRRRLANRPPRAAQLGLRQAKRSERVERRELPGCDTVRYADSVVSIAGQFQRGMFGSQAFNLLYPPPVTGRVLRHRPSPAVNAHKARLGPDVCELAELAPDDVNQFSVAQLQGALILRAAEETADQRLVRRCAMREFGMDEGAGQDAALFTAGDKKTESGRRGGEGAALVAQGQGDRRGVRDLPQFGGEPGIHILQERACRRGRSGQNDAVKNLRGTVARDNPPRLTFSLQSSNRVAGARGGGMELGCSGVGHLLHAASQRGKQRGRWGGGILG